MVDVEPTNDVVVCIAEGSSRVMFFGLFLRCCVVLECIFTLYILLLSSELLQELLTVGIKQSKFIAGILILLKAGSKLK